MPLPGIQQQPAPFSELRRDPPRTPGWSGRLLMFGATMFFVSAALYLGLLFGYQPYLAGRVSDLDAEIKAFSAQIPLETQVKIANFYAQIGNIKKLLANHTVTTPLLAFLEDNTLPTVRYTRLSADVPAAKISLYGEARSMEDVGAQAKVFENAPAVKQVVVGKSTVDQAGLWTFDMTVVFIPGFFTPQSPAANLSP